jgi:hypothetical protein
MGAQGPKGGKGDPGSPPAAAVGAAADKQASAKETSHPQNTLVSKSPDKDAPKPAGITRSEAKSGKSEDAG